MLKQPYAESYSNKSAKSIHENDPKEQPVIGAFVQLYYFIIGAAALPARLLFRENFGERSISPSGLAVSFFLIWFYVIEYIILFNLGFGFFVNANLFDLPWNEISKKEIIFLIISIFLNGFTLYIIQLLFRARKHFKSIIKKEREGTLSPDSFYRGDLKYFNKYIGKRKWSILGKFTVDDQFLRIVVEPRMIIWGGLIFFLLILPLAWLWFKSTDSFIDNIIGFHILLFSSVGLLIALSGFCLRLEELGLFLRIRYAALSMVDNKRDLNMILKKKELLSDKMLQDEKSEKQAPSNNFPIVKIVSN